MSSTPPPVASLVRLGGNLYAEHCQRKPTIVYHGGYLGGQMGPCRCSDAGPDPACEVGFTLDNMRKAEARRFDDGRRPR